MAEGLLYILTPSYLKVIDWGGTIAWLGNWHTYFKSMVAKESNCNNACRLRYSSSNMLD